MPFFGAGTSLADRIQQYFAHARMAPGMIRSVRITASEKTSSSPASVTIKIIHRVNSDPSANYTPCRIVVICESNLGIYERKVETALNDNEDHLYFDDEIQDSDDTHYWIGVFAPEV